MKEKPSHRKVNIIGLSLEEWKYQSCVAHVAIGDTWATLYDISSGEEGNEHATKLLSEIKAFYEKKGLKFGGTVALNSRMSFIYRKCGVKEYK